MGGMAARPLSSESVFAVLHHVALQLRLPYCGGVEEANDNDPVDSYPDNFGFYS